MPYSTPSSTKIPTLATSPFFLILVGVLCLSVNLLWWQLCTFYCPLRRCTLFPKGKDVHIQQHIHQKDLKLCLPLYHKVISELEKTQTRNLAVFMSRQFKSFDFGNGSRISDEKVVILELKYFQNKKWQKQAVKSTRIKKNCRIC